MQPSNDKDPFLSENYDKLYASDIRMQRSPYDPNYIQPTTGQPLNPSPILSNNPESTNIMLFKELTGYPNYGNPSRNADIIYTRTRGTWTFTIPSFLFIPGNMRTQMIIRAVLDDHANVPVSRYALKITINGVVVHDARVPLEHGVPAGGMFTNWRELSFNVPTLRRVTQITIENTSTANADDWIAFDWMQMRLMQR